MTFHLQRQRYYHRISLLKSIFRPRAFKRLFDLAVSWREQPGAIIYISILNIFHCQCQFVFSTRASSSQGARAPEHNALGWHRVACSAHGIYIQHFNNLMKPQIKASKLWKLIHILQASEQTETRLHFHHAMNYRINSAD